MLTRALEDRPLDEVVARLRDHPRATGALLVGSAHDGAMGPHSDIDLVLVVAGMRSPLSSALARIDGRLADVVILSHERLRDALAAGKPPPRGYWRQGIGEWLHEGRILFERDGLLSRLAELTGTEPAGPSYGDRYAAWYAGYYALHQLERLLELDDPAVRLHVELRLGYLVHQAAQYYFLMRALPWSGSRAGLRWMATHDPQTFQLLADARRTAEPRTAFELTSALMDRVMEPLGPWPSGHAAVGFERAARLDAAAAAEGLELLESLLG